MGNKQLVISSKDLEHKGKVLLIKRFLARCSGKITTYEYSLCGDQLSIKPDFKSQDAYDAVESGILDILGNMCEELDDDGCDCSQHYDCCDCGGNDCGCRGCFSCNACEHCMQD